MSSGVQQQPASVPAPRSSPPGITVSELKALIDDPNQRAGVDYVVVDVRRADMDVSKASWLDPFRASLLSPFRV
jgi:hypothetical protein